MPTVLDGPLALEITLLHPPDGGDSFGVGQEIFLRWWSAEARRRSAPRPRWTGEDRKIAITLLKRHGYERLKLLAAHFWRRHASSVTRSSYDRHMVLFAAKIPIIEQELKSQA